MAEQIIYVPVSLKGLMVTENTERIQYFKEFYDYSTLPEDNSGALIEKEFKTTQNMELGIHLHWSLPDGLTQGIENDTKDDFDFYDVPNMWIVTRLWSVDNKIQSKNWFVCSNAVFKEINEFNKGSHSIYIDKKNNKDIPYRYLGASYPVGKNVQIDEYLESLKAVEAGDLSYSAYYPSSRNVFGFYDDLSDLNVKEADICYCVSGYYDQLTDPLIAIATSDDCQKKLGWKVPESTSFKNLKTMCHGMLLDVHWNGFNTEQKSSITTAPTIHIGNTTSEALAATNKNKDNERFLNHLLSGNHDLIDSSTSVNEAEGKLHEERFFYNYSSGSYFLKPKNKDYDKVSFSNSNVLDKMNHLSEEISRQQVKLDEWIQKINDQWVKMNALLKEVLTKEIYAMIEECEGLIKELIPNVAALKKEISKNKLEIEELSKQIDQKNFELAVLNKTRYCEPNNIVMLLSGADRDYSHGFDGRNSQENTLKVRIKAISKMTVELSDKEASIYAKDLIKHSFDKSTNVPFKHIENLINEALLLNTGFSKVLAIKLIKDYQLTESIEMVAKTIRALQTAGNICLFMKDLDSADISQLAGMDSDFPAKVGIEYFKQTYDPLYITWNAEYYADKNTLGKNANLNNWKKQGDDFVLSDAKSISREPIKVQDKALIGPHGANLLKASLDRLGMDLNGAEDLMVLSQELDGLNHFLLQQKGTFKMKPYSTTNSLLATKVYNAIKDVDYTSCQYDSIFAPLRAGLLKFSQVMVIDVFGQTQKLNIHQIKTSESLTYKDNFVLLPPRILQPSRFFSVWQNNPNNDSPVYGFIVPNILETSLHVYSDTGEYLGYFQKVNDKNKPIKWFRPYGEATDITQLKELINADLYQFIYGIERFKGDCLSDLVNVMDLSLTSINPKNTVNLDPMNILFGRPLALIKVMVGLETKHEVMRKKTLFPNKEESIDLNQVDFPVYVGQSNNQNDGTIGFFLDNDYSKMHCSRNKPVKRCDYFAEDNYFHLRLNAGVSSLSIIADPIGQVNLETLLLPKLTLRVEQQIVSKILDNLFHTVFVAPTIVYPKEIRIPVPDVEGKKWSFIHFEDDEQIEEENILPTTEAINFETESFEAKEGWLKLTKKAKEEDHDRSLE